MDTRLDESLSAVWKAAKLRKISLRRIGLAAEIAPTAVLLASSDGDLYVGQTLSPNGGDIFLERGACAYADGPIKHVSYVNSRRWAWK